MLIAVLAQLEHAGATVRSAPTMTEPVREIPATVDSDAGTGPGLVELATPLEMPDTGKAQFVVIQQLTGDGNHGIQADNNRTNNDLTPRSAPTLFNLTLVG
jgi:hypothetical protein